MDFWSRLIGGAGSSPTRFIKTNTPAERLATCKRLCASIEQIWRSPTPLSGNAGIVNFVTNCLRRLNTILDEESQTQATFSCQLYVASTKIYIDIVKLTLSLRDSEVLDASARLFHILINGEADEVLNSQVFARCLTDFVRQTTDATVVALNEEEQATQVELLFGVATKIRKDTRILPAWFYPERDQPPDENASGFDPFAGATRRYDFPLFYRLLAYVYNDGRSGDFARTGLLYLIEIASTSEDLEKWIVESDLATHMGSGLGALYSRLSRAPPSFVDDQSSPSILTLSESSPLSADHDDAAPDLQHNTNAFLSFLMFWQDTLDHCASVEVTDTLLDHFQVLFLQQVLYPSLLESSDLNEGSTSSIMIYLCRMLDSLDHPALTQRLLQYLFASQPQPMSDDTSTRRPRMSFSRRKTVDRLATLAKVANNPSPILFNLMDMIVLSLQSKYTQTVAATFKLVSIILQKHHNYAVSSFSEPGMVAVGCRRNIAFLNADLEKLFKFAGTISNKSIINDSYEKLLKDVLALLQNHKCPALLGEGQLFKHSDPSYAYCPKESLVELIIGHLKYFFANDTTVNLLLTESIVSLACCSVTSIDGWLLPSSAENATHQNTPAISAVVESLIGQVTEVQAQIFDWDTMIISQRTRLAEETVAEVVRSNGVSSENRRTSSNRPSPTSCTPDVQTVDLPRDTRRIHTRSPTPRSGTPQGNIRNESFAPFEGALSASPSLRVVQQLSPKLGPPSSRIEHRSPALAYQPLTRIFLAADAETAELPFHPVVQGFQTTATSDGLSSRDDSLSERQSTNGKRNLSVSLSHFLTNAIILQEFVLEIAAIVQIRASLLGEVEIT